MTNNYNLSKISWLIFAGILCSMPLNSQTIVEVLADQSEKLQIVVSGELYYETDSSVIFGEYFNITGGSEPFRYSWFDGDLLIGTSQSLEILLPVDSESYTLMVSDDNNCSVILTVEHGLPLRAGWVTGSNQPVSVYPVPASRYITIDPHDITGVLSVIVYSSHGSLMQIKTISGKTDLEIDFPPGTYFMRIEDENKQVGGLIKFIVL
jgi:hypothetical protein